MTQLHQILPELDMQEMNYVQSLVKNFNDNQLYNFANMYRGGEEIRRSSCLQL
jgi:hypothetical protein